MGIAPSCGLNRDDGKRKSGSESATEKQQRSFQLSAVVGGKGLWVAAWKKAADFCRYSYLRATIGSTRIARRAGIYVARKATTTNPSDAMPNVAASVDRKSTRLNSSHGYISYAVFCFKKKTALSHCRP